MAVSDAILMRLLELHPKIIDLSLDRMWRLLDRLDNPQDKLPPVVHIAGTNGKGSTLAYARTMIAAAGLAAHAYTSPHLVKFHERIRLGTPGGGELIPEAMLVDLLEECEQANGGEPITFFEITTAAAMLAFSRHKADYLLLEVGLGGRLDATNVIARPAVTVITPVDMDHEQYLGDTLGKIAFEKAGILKAGVPGVIGVQHEEARDAIERQGNKVGAVMSFANQDFQCFEQYGRMVYQDETALIDLDLPPLPGRFQIDNAGLAIAAVRALKDERIGHEHIAAGIAGTRWTARMELLEPGYLHTLVPEGTELWLDGGHNPSAGRAVSAALADLDERSPRPLVLVTGLLNTKRADGYLKPFAGLVQKVLTIAIPGEENTIPAADLARQAQAVGLDAQVCRGLEEAIRLAGQVTGQGNPARVVIGGSLYLAGNVLALHRGQTPSQVSGTARR
ncbi:MAG: folylpolyglutamate synthase/dihydrofolate synthase family protein [Anderseniella sp.]|jgi:dihydrofolate synthase/folylpolyglutamate synthase|nr:folylpolyglutamate synthase/dihydrofolate synthase family protein [Anderseniella sp.]